VISPYEFEGLARAALASLLPNSAAQQTGDCRWTAAAPGVEVTVDYEPALAELTVWLNQPNQKDHPFEISDILRATECPETSWQRLTSTHTTDPTVAADLLDFATSAIQAFGEPFLRGDERAFNDARARRSERAAAYTTGVNLAPTLRAAEEAWIAGDLRRVAEVLGSARDQLPNREARRLAFAESRLGRVAEDEGQV
jgi:hypothetical protein